MANTSSESDEAHEIMKQPSLMRFTQWGIPAGSHLVHSGNNHRTATSWIILGPI